MTNRPEYLAIWLGISRVGAVVALLNINLTGPSLAHCIDVVIAEIFNYRRGTGRSVRNAVPHLSSAPAIWTHG